MAKIDLMEDWFDPPMAFEEDRVPPNPFVPGQEVSTWGKGITVYGAARGYRQQQCTPTLMAIMFGFDCEERDGRYQAVPAQSWRVPAGAGE